eukprot:scaffold15544_cov130-Amphora_coffeaeformis.AAC.1
MLSIVENGSRVNHTRYHHQLGSNRIWQVHNEPSELGELLAMQRLRHVVANHLIGWTVLNLKSTFLLLVGHEEVSDVEMARAFASARSAICL